VELYANSFSYFSILKLGLKTEQERDIGENGVMAIQHSSFPKSTNLLEDSLSTWLLSNKYIKN
jgi:hypothetical protein